MSYMFLMIEGVMEISYNSGKSVFIPQKRIPFTSWWIKVFYSEYHDC